jgi:hypothetical protein
MAKVTTYFVNGALSIDNDCGQFPFSRCFCQISGLGIRLIQYATDTNPDVDAAHVTWGSDIQSPQTDSVTQRIGWRGQGTRCTLLMIWLYGGVRAVVGCTQSRWWCACLNFFPQGLSPKFPGWSMICPWNFRHKPHWLMGLRPWGLFFFGFIMHRESLSTSQNQSTEGQVPAIVWHCVPLLNGWLWSPGMTKCHRPCANKIRLVSHLRRIYPSVQNS